MSRQEPAPPSRGAGAPRSAEAARREPGRSGAATTVASGPAAEEIAAVADHVRAALGSARVAVLTGAGLSTDSGIPDYRGPDSPPRQPMTYQQFVGSAAFRRHYWARNHLGWRHMGDARPNDGHRALARLEREGVLNGLITQNVDTLHQAAGSRHVIDLHGRYDRVICLACQRVTSRAALADRLAALNPEFTAEHADVEAAPDADAAVGATDSFRVADCDSCGGTLKPDIVYFGENVPKERVERAYALVDHADALLVAGSSLTVWSGLRFVRRAARQDTPVVIVNRGETRGDDLATLKADTGCSPLLRALSERYAV